MLQAAAVFHIGMAKGGPPVPDGLSPECRDFLTLCFNRCRLPVAVCLPPLLPSRPAPFIAAICRGSNLQLGLDTEVKQANHVVRQAPL